jgi:ketosteroid isomerase-like protein
MGIPEEQLVERLRQGYDAFNRGDYDAATEWVHPDVVYVGPGSIAEVRGVEALRAWMEPDAFEGQVSTPHEIEIAGNRALIRQTTRARGAGSGIEMEGASWAVWIFDEDGRVTRMETYLEHDEEAARRSFRGTRD